MLTKVRFEGNLYPMQADILVHEVFCRMASRRAMIDRWKKPWELWKLSMGDGNHMKMCLLDEEKALYKSKVALEHIEQMWEAYSETPKFAFLNSIIAHSYHSDESKVNVPTEQYDEMLSQFLKRLLESKSAKRTIIVVRSDHGLQDGPFRVDYSLQTEALRPWTELVVPKGLPGFDVRKLAENQDSLVTGFDLYHTLAKTIGARSPDKISVPSGWSYHLWKEIVPNHRTCSDARIPSDFCFFEEEHSNSTISPNFGTCNRGEQNQFIFCHVRRKYMQKKLATHSIKLVEKQELWMSLDKAIYDEGDAEADMRIRPSSWQEIDKIVAQSQNKQVSGGIFLYPRQMALLRNVVAYLAKTMGIGAGSRSRDELRRLRVCETGFGAGHSAALFLNASESLVLYSFDKFDRNYQIDAAFYLNSTYQNRLITRAGDSCRTVPQSLSSEGSGNQTDGLIHCDFLHGSSLCNRDNIDLVENSPCGIILTSTAMFSLYDKDVYFGERAQWNNLIQRGCIKDVACFEERPTQVKGNFVFAEDGDVMKSVFCIAVTTGLCRRNTPPEGEIDLTCHDKISRITRKLDVSNLAKRFQVPLCIAGDDAGEKGDFRHSLAKKDSNQRQPKDTKRRAIQNESRQSKRTQKVALQVPLSIVRDGVEERDAFRSSLTKQDGIPS